MTMNDNNTTIEIAVDFDGTCVEHKYPKVGKSVPVAVEVLKELTQQGHRLILYTMRSGKELKDAEKWFKDNNISLYAVQKNPTQHEWTESNKCYAQMYIDDAALGCPLIYPANTKDRPYVDWVMVAYILVHTGVLQNDREWLVSLRELEAANVRLPSFTPREIRGPGENIP